MKILHFNTIDSTSKEAFRQKSQLTAPFCIVADQQEAGHGSRGRKFQSAIGGLYSSFGMNLPNQVIRTLSLQIGIFIAEFIFQKWNLRARLKWPNDIYLCRKKVGGILCESYSQGSNQSFVIIGIGLNIFNAIPEVSSATCIAAQLNQPIDFDSIPPTFREQFCNFIVAKIEKMTSFQTSNYQAYHLNLQLPWIDFKTQKYYKIAGFNKDGSLQLQKQHSQAPALNLFSTENSYTWAYKADLETPFWIQIDSIFLLYPSSKEQVQFHTELPETNHWLFDSSKLASQPYSLELPAKVSLSVVELALIEGYFAGLRKHRQQGSTPKHCCAFIFVQYAQFTMHLFSDFGEYLATENGTEDSKEIINNLRNNFQSTNCELKVITWDLASPIHQQKENQSLVTEGLMYLVMAS